jgi:hypothetical protein
MTVVDLDAARAARREADKEGPTVTLDGKSFVLPVELPFAVTEAFMKVASSGDNPEQSISSLATATRLLLGDRYEEFMALGPSVNDLLAMFDGIVKEYGLDTGESSPSE